MVSRELNLKRDKKIEYFILLGLWKSKKLVKILKRNCRCYLDYYEERGIEVGFEDLDYITNRIIAQYNIIKNKETLETEIENFDNPFCQSYVKDRIKEILNIGDTRNKNLVVGAVI